MISKIPIYIFFVRSLMATFTFLLYIKLVFFVSPISCNSEIVFKGFWIVIAS